MTTVASEQNPAQRQQAESLPETQRLPSEKRRQQPVPQAHHNLAANEYKERNANDRRWNNPPFLSHKSPFTSTKRFEPSTLSS
jgi:hypothetical protein